MLLNISTRARIETGDHVLIGGFILNGTAPKRVIARGLGPSLSQAGVSNALEDPQLELYSANGPLAANDNWEDTERAAILETDFQPRDPREAAILITLQPGAYTVIESGFQNSQGVGLVEVYDLDSDSPTRLANISTRGVVQAGDNVMIGGIIVGGADAGSFVIRAIGPSLAGAGINDPLPNPLLEVYDRNGALIGYNDDWRQSQEAELQASGFAPTNDLEPAILRTLSPGAYTAIVRSISESTSGVALIEIYRQ